MVLESLTDVHFIRRNPVVMLFLAIVVSSVGMWIAYFTFPESASVLAIANIAIALVPIMHRLFVVEEVCEIMSPGGTLGFLSRHGCALKIYTWLFIGLIVSYAFWYVAMPIEVKESVFAQQDSELDKISDLKTQLTGNAYMPITACDKDFWCWFQIVMYNNSSVLLWAILFSFIYGAGAIFLISWNASIIGIVVGRDIIGLVASYAHLGVGWDLAAAYMHGLFNALGFLPHGLPEALGYFIGAFAGAIISVAISKRQYRSKEFETIAKDAFILVLIALLFILIGALIEAYLLISM
ncbi:MAG: stage II sporulation protein M [Candidatus Diapherotrites archaeon]